MKPVKQYDSGRIYALVDPETGAVRYCGKTVRTPRIRLGCHRRDAEKFQRRHVSRWLLSVYARGLEPLIVVCEEIDFRGLSLDEQRAALDAAEIKWIKRYRAAGENLTNQTDGGDGAHGLVRSPETIAKTRLAHLGRKKSDQERKRISEACRLKPASAYLRGEAHQNYGKPLAFKDNAARIAKLKAAWDCPEKRAAQSERMKGTMSAEELAKQSARHRCNKHATKQTREQALAILNAVGSHREVAKRYGVSHQLVGLIKRGLRWPELSI